MKPITCRPNGPRFLAKPADSRSVTKWGIARRGLEGVQQLPKGRKDRDPALVIARDAMRSQSKDPTDAPPRGGAKRFCYYGCIVRGLVRVAEPSVAVKLNCSDELTPRVWKGTFAQLAP